MEVKEGYVFDYISGNQVKATPEEMEAVQVFSRILVEDYGYKKDQIQTRPQFRVKRRPSGNQDYPVDIAVFQNKEKTEDNLYIIVECKKKERKDGRRQLENYLELSKASLGVWFNGEEQLFLLKTYKEGKVIFNEIPNIPKQGQRIEDIGKYTRADLKPTHNLKATFKAIRNYLAANNVGATRDEVLAQQLINIIFCKIYDEKFTPQDEFVTFRAGIEEKEKDVAKRIKDLFLQVKTTYKEVFDNNDNITLDDKNISYVVGTLQNYCLIEAERDVVADAFEVFIGHALKGGQGQFFTPRNVIKMMIEILNPTTKDTIIDPACGSGGFIVEALRYVWKQIDDTAKKNKWNEDTKSQEKMTFATNNVRGIDKDYFLAKVTKAYFAIVGDGKGGVFCDDSLERPANWKKQTQAKIELNSFSVVLTNPPFGSKIPVSGEDKLQQYELAHKWKHNKQTDDWEKNKPALKEAPQILFIERCLQLLKDGGRMAIVLPDGIYGNDQLGYIRKFILKQCRLVAVIDVPIETFMPNTGTKTSILIIQKLRNIPKNYPVFMCVSETCGHDRRGNEIEDDDISQVSNEFHKWMKYQNFKW